MADKAMENVYLEETSPTTWKVINQNDVEIATVEKGEDNTRLANTYIVSYGPGFHDGSAIPKREFFPTFDEAAKWLDDNFRNITQ